MKKRVAVMPMPHEPTPASSAFGIWSYASSHPNALAVPKQNSATAASLPVSSKAALSCLPLIWR